MGEQWIAVTSVLAMAWIVFIALIIERYLF
ncbi:hypothetical protein SAMN04490208_3261 [Pseudomonas poae]|uniref:Uncharacterized protein n=1 Tax=Pseudomonas poae TaxID=200451 RepID=A0ABY0RMF0_9PSED|nr:hypothetical protein SAMN04490208_3261 [Pseudomonas poae]